MKIKRVRVPLVLSVVVFLTIIVGYLAINNCIKYSVNAMEDGRYALYFDANGGIHAVPYVACSDFGSCVVQVPSSEPSNSDGYDFLGWSWNQQGDENFYPQVKPGDNITLDSDKYLYAVWGYVISFDANGGTFIIPTQYCMHTGSVGCSAILPENIPSIDTDDVFLGWATSSGASTAEFQPGDDITLDADTTLYAVWGSLPVYTLTLNANGGNFPTSSSTTLTCSPETLSGSCNVAIPSASSNPTREGYVFYGYAESVDAGIGAPSVHNGQTVLLSKNQTIYAVWVKLVKIYTSVPNSGGSISISGSTYNNEASTAEEGTSISIRFSPEEGYSLKTVTVNNIEKEASNNILNLTVGNQDIYIVASFENPSGDPEEDDEGDGEDLIVPDTDASGNNESNDAGNKTPDTGANTNNSNGSGMIGLYALPIIVAAVLGGLFTWKRSKAHRKFEW